MPELTGLTALVTGGGSGIGLATARLLASRGAEVAVLDLKPGDESTSVTADVTDDASVRLAVETAAGRLGGLDILVNNAGIGSIGTVADNPDEEWHRVFDVNVVGIVRVTRAALPYLRALGARGDRQHLLGRGDGGTAAARGVLGDQGSGAVADAGDGRRPRPRGHPGELRQPRHRRHAVGRPAARSGGRPGRRARCAQTPGSRWACWSARTRSPRASPTWPARWRRRSPERRWR